MCLVYTHYHTYDLLTKTTTKGMGKGHLCMQFCHIYVIPNTRFDTRITEAILNVTQFNLNKITTNNTTVSSRPVRQLCLAFVRYALSEFLSVSTQSETSCEVETPTIRARTIVSAGTESEISECRVQTRNEKNQVGNSRAVCATQLDSKVVWDRRRWDSKESRHLHR